MLTALQMFYTCDVLVNPETAESHLLIRKAQTAYSISSGFFVRSAVSFYEWAVQGVERLTEFLSNRYANLHSLLSLSRIEESRFSKLARKELAMYPTYELTKAVSEFRDGTLSPEDAQQCARIISAGVKSVLTVVSNALASNEGSQDEAFHAVQLCAALLETVEELEAR